MSNIAPPSLPPIDQQTVEELGGRDSVLARQRRDHIKLDILLRRLHEVRGQARDRTLLELRRLVFPHAFAEEAVLWPALRKMFDDGHEMTLAVEREHQEINHLFTQLEEGDGGDDEELLVRVSTLLRQDARDEERLLLPRLQEALDNEELRKLGKKWEFVRRTAPTRAHPVVSRRPPGNVLSALPLSAIDRSRDRLDGLAHLSSGPVGSASRSASKALAKVSGATEHLPAFKKGEDPSTKSRQ